MLYEVITVSDELRNVSQALAEEFTMVNLEIRAGAQRAQPVSPQQQSYNFV